SSRPTLRSTTSASIITIDTSSDLAGVDSRRRRSLFDLLRTSRALSNTGPAANARSVVYAADFGQPPEHPEKRFIDSVGIVIPGVCDRIQCLRSSAHFIISWRLCEPIEYTTSLADHGVTYSDYSRLVAALANFLDGIPREIRRRNSDGGSSSNVRGPLRWFAKSDASGSSLQIDEMQAMPDKKRKSISVIESPEQFRKTAEQASILNRLLSDITWNLRHRGVPVMVCIESFSLFSPSRISEAQMQVLHVPLESRRATDGALDYWSKHRSPDGMFIDDFKHSEGEGHNPEGQCVLRSAKRLSHNRRSVSSPSPTAAAAHKFIYPHQMSQQRDRSVPWPLWPNAIPMRKRGLIEDYADRYGMDPYFRAWVRANVNSRTRSTSYAKYLIERENNPFINKRLSYVHAPPRTTLLWGLLSEGYDNWKTKQPSIANRENYEHNRKLEARRTVELGFRLRLARFAFRHPLHLQHTPEMEKLGLTQELYTSILEELDKIRDNHSPKFDRCECPFQSLLRKFRRRGPEAAIPEVKEYIKRLNSYQRGVVWTLEEIPGVYERGVGQRSKEWEISIWNGEDPLELLLQLEKWGIIEKRLT
ncbi:hypothetical protein BDV96DRAFT_462477, partial [Lophiotrema nucula]